MSSTRRSTRGRIARQSASSTEVDGLSSTADTVVLAAPEVQSAVEAEPAEDPLLARERKMNTLAALYNNMQVLQKHVDKLEAKGFVE